MSAIADGVHNRQSEEFAELTKQIAQLSVTSNTILARLELLDAASGSVAPKRSVRSASSKAAPAKSGAKKTTASPVSKITNALLFFRYIMAQDLDGARATYGGEADGYAVIPDEVLANAAVSKHAADSVEQWSSAGSVIWSSILSVEQKAEIRAQFANWKNSAERDAAEPQLSEETEVTDEIQ